MPFYSVDRELFNVSLSLGFPLIMSFPASEVATVSAHGVLALDEHPVIKIGETKVGQHLHQPMHKKDLTIMAFSSCLLSVTGQAAL